MPIDVILPRHHVAKRHATTVRAPPERVYAAVGELDMGRSPLVRALFLLRGMPPSTLTLRGLLGDRFVLLAEEPGRELLIGLAGRFWTPTGDLQRLDPASFAAFDRPGYAKAVWSFSVAPRPDGAVELATETRVLCLDAESRRRFLRYWRVVGPFSGLVRREALRLVRARAERA